LREQCVPAQRRRVVVASAAAAATKRFKPPTVVDVSVTRALKARSRRRSVFYSLAGALFSGAVVEESCWPAACGVNGRRSRGRFESADVGTIRAARRDDFIGVARSSTAGQLTDTNVRLKGRPHDDRRRIQSGAASQLGADEGPTTKWQNYDTRRRPAVAPAALNSAGDDWARDRELQ